MKIEEERGWKDWEGKGDERGRGKEVKEMERENRGGKRMKGDGGEKGMNV